MVAQAHRAATVVEIVVPQKRARVPVRPAHVTVATQHVRPVKAPHRHARLAKARRRVRRALLAPTTARHLAVLEAAARQGRRLAAAACC